MTKPTFISLFSGCGGMDAGFIKAGFSCLGAFDNNKKVVETHNNNLGNSARVADLTRATTVDLVPNSKPDVIISGSPCQGFSTAGRRDINDPRNSLLLRAGEITVEALPKVFVAENVSGALAGEHKKYWLGLDKMLRDAGYKTKTLYLNASEIGLAQRRARVILLAWRVSGEPHFVQSKYRTQTSLREALDGLQGNISPKSSDYSLNNKQKLIAKKIKPGQKLCDVRGGSSAIHTWDIPEVFGPTTEKEREVLETTLVMRRRDRKRDWGDADPILISSLTKEVGFASSKVVRALIRKGYMREMDGYVDLAYTFNGLYKRLSWDSISPTVDTKFGNPRFFLHPSEDRGFSVREAARIQGFPDWFDFTGSDKDNFKMIGNAVPPPMGACIASLVHELLRSSQY